MTIMNRFKNINMRILVSNEKTSIKYTRRTQKELLDLFERMILNPGETAILQVFQNNEWVNKETRYNLNLRKINAN
jgi:hypothetical protein